MSGLRFSIRELMLVTLVVALILGWGVQTYLRAWPTARERALMQEKLDALKEVVNTRKHLHGVFWDGGKSLRDAECAALAMELDLCTSASQRLAVLERVLTTQQLYEKNATYRYDKGSGTWDELLSAKADRLTAEIALERAKAGR